MNGGWRRVGHARENPGLFKGTPGQGHEKGDAAL